MEKQYQRVFDAVEENKQMILDAERYIWKNPETGFREWKTHAYMKKAFEDLGYDLVEAGNIPGFYTDLDTGKPGPKLAVFGELDSLIVPTHPECDPETGAAHTCGHNCQCAALLGVAAALKAPGALEGLSGSIRLIAVPAEEGIEIGFRQKLREQGAIRYLSGKLEFLYRGYLDGVDLAMMVHTSSNKGLNCSNGSNGSVTKTAVFRGVSSHAGGSPHLGKNALYAATTAMSAANALRETFRDKDKIRFHPIITKGGAAVNAIPDEVVTESYVRGANLPAIRQANEKMNLAFAGAAAAMGCTVELNDEHGYAPRLNDENLQDAFHEIGAYFFSEEEMKFHDGWGGGCSDMGDVCCVMPGVHPSIGGAVGRGHADNYYIEDPVTACVTCAKVQAGVVIKLLSEDAAFAKKVVAEAKVPYASVEEYLKEIEGLNFCANSVTFKEDGTVALRYKN